MPITRRALLTSSALVAGTGLLTLVGCSPAPAATGTGRKTEVMVKVQGMRFVPDVIEVPKGNDLVVTLENTGDVVHDLVFANDADSGQISPGESVVIKVGVISADLDGWCSVSNHRALGMVVTVKAVG
ncbi:plastocyanin [Microbacterium sp. W4I4]|uniref:cupredoxin domain-containing protein n=1 Tax=Microbacterium sp. W4I4 TaxID=3042295 RepID=UPI00277F11AD|nr:cupredoxin domain-containing protein [Microbacterium sp. W4I4]MDQ0614706.1 plastocyanin [Microbacterium sp. W4I4]